MKNEMKLEIKAKSINEGFCRSVVGAFLAQLNPSLDELNDVKTAVSEAITNSVVHGYAGRDDGKIEVGVLIDKDLATIKITDYGVGIKNIKQAREPFFTTRAEEERSGMGFTVMESFMDALDVVSDAKKTVITLKKRFNTANLEIEEQEILKFKAR